MSVFQTLLNLGRLYPYRKAFNWSYSGCKCLFVRKSSDIPKKFVSFDEIAAQRRDEARRSLVIQVNSEASYRELYGYCSRYASLNGIHHYKNSVGENFMIIEFVSEDNLKDVLHSCSTHQKDLDVTPLQSPFLWFRASTDKREKFDVPNTTDLVIKNAIMGVDEEKLFEDLVHCKSVSEQIQLLYDRTALNDLGVRLRYIVARQIECVLESLYANLAVTPFGSSINGFGKLGCDLDLVITNTFTDDMCDSNKRLVYHEKRAEGGRAPVARHLELAAEALELRAAGAGRVQRILHARVPIVKFRHLLADLDCDLAFNHTSAVHMSELLWLLGELDPRVRPLVFVIRRWAQTVGLTNPHPGRWITNFPLTLMVLFFLQQKTKHGRILPTIRTLIKNSGEDDMRVADDNVNCTFLRDMNKLPIGIYGGGEADLQTLLLQFFEFYAQFDFQDKAISVISGETVRKPAVQPLYIVNPLEPALNVARNVSYEECERLKLEVRNAAWQLEGISDAEHWGLLPLLQRSSVRALNKLVKTGNSHRLVSVKDLFDDEPPPPKTKSSAVAPKPADSGRKEPIKFKNSQVAGEVYRIRRNKIV